MIALTIIAGLILLSLGAIHYMIDDHLTNITIILEELDKK